VSLYFLKKEMVDKVKKVTGWEEGMDWQVFKANPGGYQVKLPGKPIVTKEDRDQPIPTVIRLDCYKLSHKTPFLGDYVFVAGASPKLKPIVKAKDDGPEPGTDEWYDRAVQEIVDRSGGQLVQDSSRAVPQQEFMGREFVIEFKNGKARVVHLFL